MEKKTIYQARHMLTKEAQDRAEKEKRWYKEAGYKVYSPKDDKSINDKSKQTGDLIKSLAKRIVENDTRAIINSDLVIIQPRTNDAIGTCVEAGQIKGMRDAYRDIINRIKEDFPQEIVDKYIKEFKPKYDKKVFAYYDDIRRENGLPQCGDDREFGMHKYVEGIIKDITDGEGFLDLETELIPKLRKIREIETPGIETEELKRWYVDIEDYNEDQLLEELLWYRTNECEGLSDITKVKANLLEEELLTRFQKKQKEEVE